MFHSINTHFVYLYVTIYNAQFILIIICLEYKNLKNLHMPFSNLIPFSKDAIVNLFN